MRIENTAPFSPEYRKTTGGSAPRATFGQALESRSQDRYVPSEIPRFLQTEADFSRAERTYGNAAVNNATRAKLKQLMAVNAGTDYTGMSSEEVFETIWNRYNEAFDGNMTTITACISGPIEWEVVNNQFVHEINHRVCVPELNAYKAAREANTREEKQALEESAHAEVRKILHNARLKVMGYEGMDFDEIETAIQEKYAGKNTVADFLGMQSELRRTGVLEHKMGEHMEGIYCDMIDAQLQYAFNPDYLRHDSRDVVIFDMTSDQWRRIANQPMDTAKLASSMKEHLQRISAANGYTADMVKSMEAFIDRFVKAAEDDSVDRLLQAAER